MITDTQTQEYQDAYIKVRDADAIYVSQNTTRAIVADAWAKLEENLVDLNDEFNATDTDKEPHARILTLLSAAGEVERYANVIYTLTLLPEDEPGQSGGQT